MALTPVKIRGKRNRKGEPAHEPRKVQKVGKRDNQNRPRRSKFSAIEMSLPLEVLERIFWFSENVNFPRASHLIGRLLSGVPTLHKTIIAAFGPTWDLWYRHNTEWPRPRWPRSRRILESLDSGNAKFQVCEILVQNKNTI